MSEQDPRRHLAALVQQHLDDTHRTARAFIQQAALNENTTYSFLTGKRRTSDSTVRAITDALGWDWDKVCDLLGSRAPATWTADMLAADPWEEAPAPALRDVEAAVLAGEMTRRLLEQEAELTRLRAEVEQLRATPADADDAALPADVYALAADADRSGHGRHLAAEADAAGEESQDWEEH